MVTFFLTLMAISSARAGVLDTWGGGEIGAAGNAGVATGGPHGAWYNPATLDADRFDALAEVVYGNAEFSVEPAKGRAVEPYSAGSRGVLLGIALNNYWLGLPKSNLGVSLYLPASGPFSWYDPEDTFKDGVPNATVPRWSSDLSRFDAAVGGNYWLADRFAVGAGVDISATFITLTFVEIDDLDNADDARKGEDIKIVPTFHPALGFVGIIGDLDGAQVRVGLMGRAARWMEDRGTTFVSVLGGDFLFRYHYYRHYAPPTVTLGVDVRPVEPLSIRAEASYEAWSNAHGPFFEDLSADWTDTVTFNMGAKVSVDRVRMMAGYAYDPGPAQSIPRNTLHVDGPSHSLTAGLGAVLKRVDERCLTALIGGRSQRFVPHTLAARGAGDVDFEGGLLGLHAGVGWGR